jgi:hypothetical protein
VKKDDSSLTREQRARVRNEADGLLDRADARGVFPTPVDYILQVAKVSVVSDQDITDGYIAQLTRAGSKAVAAFKSAISKVWGLFESGARLIHIDRVVYRVKQTFLKLHETGHGYLSWQRDIYAVTADCEKSLADDIKDLFEREANAFASDILFQGEGFTKEAANYDFGFDAPLKLSKKYGASLYATIRRYVSESPHAYAVLVLDPPVLTERVGFRCALRRPITSPLFDATVGRIPWAGSFSPDDAIGRMVPMWPRRMTGIRSFDISDGSGVGHECVGVAFTQKHQVFILIKLLRPLTKTTIVVPKAMST